MRIFVKDLQNQAEVPALGASRGPVGQLVTQMFRDAYKASQMMLEEAEIPKPFPKAFSREFILKALVSRPYVYSQPSPQRLFCRLIRPFLNVQSTHLAV